MNITVETLTDVGLKRKNNEDSLGYFVDEDSSRGCLMIVADGMGGASAGEVASRIAVETVRDSFFDHSAGITAAERALIALQKANAAIQGETAANPQYAGMGTTCTAAIVVGDSLTIGHVGDSRAYLVRDDSLRQLTNDHTLAAETERANGGEQAPSWIPRHLLTRSMGVNEHVEVDVISPQNPLRHGDTLIICSDGLTGPVGDEEILRISSSSDTPATICNRLVDLALDRGGPDNVTVIIARIEDR